MRIAYLAGADHHDRIELGDAILDNVGSTDLYRLRTRDPSGYARLHVTRDYFDQPIRYDLGQYDLLLNLVTDADQNPAVLASLARLVENYRGRVVNRPEAVLRTTRDQVAQACRGLARVIAPRTIRLTDAVAARRAADSGFRFPAILRLAGSHAGRILGLVDRPDRVASLMTPDRAHFLTEWRDFRSADGHFRKHRFFFIGGEIVLRHLLISDRWNVHAEARHRYMAARPALVAEERALVEQGVASLPEGVRATLSAMPSAIGLDFFGLDCALGEGGALILFEANATMCFFPLSDDPQFAYHALTLARAQRAFDAMLFGERR